MAGPNERDVNDILGNLAPVKSAERYHKDWDKFVAFVDKGPEYSPGEEDFIRYFSFLRESKEMKSSSLWTVYSRLNNTLRRL